MMENMRFITGFCCAIFVSLPMSYGADPLVAGQKALYQGTKNNLTRSAEKMPEEFYSFKPAPDVRTFGQLIGHLADYQYVFCSAAAGEKLPVSGIEETKQSKSDLLQALKEGFAYCDKVYGGMSDAKLSDMVKLEGRSMAVLTALTVNTSHNNEHYGNIVTYLRIKGLVPPSSEPR
jgi:uncharacterized damage-inducible protein DinB